MPEFAKQANADLEALATIDDSKVTRAIRLVDENNPMGEWVTEEIDNPNPMYKIKGFTTLKHVTDMVKSAMEEPLEGG